jgi:Fic family protein
VGQASRNSGIEPLGHLETRVWPSDPTAYGGRRARRGGRYEAFIPVPIGSREFSFDADAVAGIAQATKALGGLSMNSQGGEIAGLASALLRSESMASSRIEGVEISHKRLARAAYKHDRPGGDRRAAEVLGNVKAMQHAIELGVSSNRIRVADIEDIHRTLRRFTEDEEIAGVVRDRQNWIGGNDYNPLGADYVPPPPEYVPDLLEDLCVFIARDDLAPIAQAAIAHAQFENVHPFAEGNGRTGRALIYTILRRRGEIESFVPPISLVLGAQPKSYINGLGAYSAGRVANWCMTFADATSIATQAADGLTAAIEELQASWIERLDHPRADATVRRLIEALPAQPVIDVAAGQRLTDRSHVAVGNALQQLQEHGVIQKLNERRWGRLWECGELLELLGRVEKRLSTPGSHYGPTSSG